MTVTEFFKNNVPFLSGLTEEQAHQLALQAEQKTFRKDQTVLFKGTTVDGISVVASGSVAVWIQSTKGKPPTQAAQLGPGDVFGETSIIEMGTSAATIKALADDTLIFEIPQEAFRQILSQNTEFQAKTLALIAQRKPAPPPPRT